MSEEKTEFKVGDIVEFAGTEGEVFEINKDIPDRYLSVNFGLSIHKNLTFRKDGKLWEWQNIPSLKLIARPKKKMNIEAWANVYFDNSYTLFPSLSEANDHEANAIRNGLKKRIACVKLVSEEFEVEK